MIEECGITVLARLEATRYPRAPKRTVVGPGLPRFKLDAAMKASPEPMHRPDDARDMNRHASTPNTLTHSLAAQADQIADILKVEAVTVHRDELVVADVTLAGWHQSSRRVRCVRPVHSTRALYASRYFQKMVL